jgi:hypothetical protein
MMNRVLWVFVALVLSSCASGPETGAVNQTVTDAPVRLDRAFQPPEDARMLNISIQVFDVEQENTGPAEVGDWIFQEILDIESQYLPVVLRNTLVESNHWGAIRVLPKSDPSADIQIEGTIYQSNGVVLEIGFVAVDSTGREWINKRYRHRNMEILGRDDQDPFQSLYNAFANDLSRILDERSDEDLLNLQRVTRMRYAADLSPETFEDTMALDENGHRQIVRLLADNDPMLERVARMRLRHHIFIDTLDEYYRALQSDVQPTYDLWRVYAREQVIEIENEQRTRSDAGTRGFVAISNNWYRYQANKMFEQEWNELAEGFTSEVAPSILELNRRVYGLTGNVEDQYDQWRELLRQFYILERGE